MYVVSMAAHPASLWTRVMRNDSRPIKRDCCFAVECRIERKVICTVYVLLINRECVKTTPGFQNDSVLYGETSGYRGGGAHENKS